MTEFTLLLSLYAALGTTYLLIRRVRVLLAHRRYRQWLKEEQKREVKVEGEEEVGGVVREYEREYIPVETVEEREYRIEQDYLSRKQIGER